VTEQIGTTAASIWEILPDKEGPPGGTLAKCLCLWRDCNAEVTVGSEILDTQV
jgi:hypothetical protein